MAFGGETEQADGSPADPDRLPLRNCLEHFETAPNTVKTVKWGLFSASADLFLGKIDRRFAFP